MVHKTIRLMLMLALLAGSVLLAMGWLLGKDFGPWMRTAKAGAKEQIARLVDEYSLAVEKAKTAVVEAEQRVSTLGVQKCKAETAVNALKRQVQTARKEVADAEKDRQKLDGRLAEGHSIRLSNGRSLSPADLQNLSADFSNRIQLAKEKLGYLEQILTMRENRFAKLCELEKQSPAAVKRLRNDIDFLERKLELYRDVKDWLQEDEYQAAQLSGLFETAKRTLAISHSKLDEKLAEVDAVLKASVDALRNEDSTSDATLLTDIHTALSIQPVGNP